MVEATGEDGNDENVDDERNKEGNARFDEKVHVSLTHGRLVLAVHFARLYNEKNYVR